MRKLVLFGSLVCLLLLALPASLAGAGAASGPNDTFTFHGVLDTTATFIGGDPTHVAYTGTGQLSKLGFVHVDGTQRLGADGAITSERVVFTGAAGDTVTIAYSAIPVGPGPVPETTISWAGPTTITGGTGRFAGASGDAWIVGGYCFVADRGFFSLDGTIMLPKER